MATRNFDSWLETFRDSINGYGYYTDFDLAYRNVESIKVELNLLNSLVGSKDIEADFRKLVQRYPAILKAIPLLLAVRGTQIYCQDENGGVTYRFAAADNNSIDAYCYFMGKTGIFELLENRIVANLYDYATGIEVGLGSNGRKNRGGHQMEDLVEEYIKKLNVEYYKEMYLAEIEQKWGLDLSAISAEGTTTKRWDFVIKTASCVYVIETNFYSSGGSKLNETARSYKMIAEEVKGRSDVCFVWITDGGGWWSARKNLHETFNVLETLFNIHDLETGKLKALVER